MLSIIFDIAVIALFWFFMIRGIKKGLVKSILDLFKGIAAFVAAFLYYKPVSEYLLKLEPVNKFIGNIQENMTQKIMSQSAETVKELPAWAERFISEGIENSAVSLTDAVSNLAVNVISALLIYVAVRILFVVFNFLFDRIKIFKLGEINAFGGACFGFLNALILVYVAMLVLFVFAATDNGALNEAIQSTYIAKFFYNNNLISNLIF